ncbi:MAG: glycosyltransferase, partial [Halodesulfurarchaeum sp.]
IDADHRFEYDAIRRAVAWFLDDETIGCVKGRCYGSNPTDSLLSLHATVERHVAEKGNIFAREVFDGFTFFGGGQAFFRADVFDELGRFDEEVLVEDIDMSSRIHEAGIGLKVDPSIITFEEHPATFEAWWNQRKRWVRGWMQVAVRYLPHLHQQSRLSQRQKADAVFTFVTAVLPALFIFSIPIVGLDVLSSIETATYIPNSELLWPIFGTVPVVAAYLIFVQDHRDGNQHHTYEYLAAFTLGPYFMLQTLVYVVAFLDEFVLDLPSVYVTTARSTQSNS